MPIKVARGFSAKILGFSLFEIQGAHELLGAVMGHEATLKASFSATVGISSWQDLG